MNTFTSALNTKDIKFKKISFTKLSEFVLNTPPDNYFKIKNRFSTVSCFFLNKKQDESVLEYREHFKIARNTTKCHKKKQSF